MRLTPRYGDEPIIRIEGLVDDPETPLMRQRLRLASLLAGLDEAQWATPSRCEGWSVQDVVAHLTTTNQFWAHSITAGAAGAPTTMLADFDPVSSPAQIVDAVRSWTPAETLQRFVRSNEALRVAVASLGDGQWRLLAEAPPGHESMVLVVMHALWDSWIHERDIALPLGIRPDEEADEILAALAYASALGPAFQSEQGSTRTGVLVVRATDLGLEVVVEIGPSILLREGPAPSDAAVLTGDGVGLVEALSRRAPLTGQIADEDRWMITGLATVFDQVD